MYEIANTFLKSELDYRADRVRSGLSGGKGRRDRTRHVRVRRTPASTATDS